MLPHGETEDAVQPRSPSSDTTLLPPWRAGLCTHSSPSPSPASAQVHVGARRLADRPGCHRAARVDQHVHFLSQQQTPRVNRKNSYHNSDSLGSPQTHTHIHTHTYIHIHTYMYTHVCTHTLWSHMSVHTPAGMYTGINIHAHTHSCMCTYKYAHIWAHIHAQTHTYTMP